MKRGLIIFFLLNVIHFHVCKPNGETDADLTAEDGLTMVDALEDDGDMMEVEDRAASGYCPLQPYSRNWCSDYRWFTEGCNKAGKQWIYNAKMACGRPAQPLYEKCLVTQLIRHRIDPPYCWPCNCRSMYKIGCEQGHLPKKVVWIMFEKLGCYSDYV